MSKGEHCREGPKHVRQHYIYLQKYMVLLKKCVHEKTLSTLTATADLYKYILELGIQKSCLQQLLHAAISKILCFISCKESASNMHSVTYTTLYSSKLGYFNVQENNQ